MMKDEMVYEFKYEKKPVQKSPTKAIKGHYRCVGNVNKRKEYDDSLSNFYHSDKSKIRVSPWVMQRYEKTHGCPACRGKLELCQKNGECMTFVCLKCHTFYKLGYRYDDALVVAYK